MESARRQRMAIEDEAWNVSAVVSAIMELFLSVLLLLGAVIAFITSQLVNYFDLEPPCTQIGCSHALRPVFTKRRHKDDHGKEDSFLVLCPNCHSFLDLSKQLEKRFLRSMCDSEISSVQEDNSATSVSDADIHHLDQYASVASDRQPVNISTCVEGIQSCTRFAKLTVENSEAFQDAVDTSRFANENCTSSMKSRSDSACTNDCNAGEPYEASATHRISLWTKNLCHDENHSKEALMDYDSSVQVIHDDSYMLLKNRDEDGDETLYHDSLEVTLRCHKLNGHLILKDDTNEFSETIKLHIENVQPLLPSLIENTFQEKEPSSKSLYSKHRQSLTLETATSSVYEDTESCKKPVTHKKSVGDGEHHYVLVGGDDKDMCEPSLLKVLHCECVQPLLNSFSNDESELPNISNMTPNKELIFDSPRSSRSEDGTYHELDELGMQATALEEGQHRYALLDNNDEDSAKVSYFENMLSDCAQPLLKKSQEDELEALRLSLNGFSSETAARVYYISGEKKFSDTSTCSQCPEESRREVACIKEIINSNRFQVEAPLHSFSFNRCDVRPGVSECSAPSGCETVLEDNIESENHKGINADLEISHSLKRSRKIDAGESLVDMENGFTPSASLLEIGLLEDIKSFDRCEPEIFLNGEVLIFKAFETELHKQRNFSEEKWTNVLEDDRVPMGLCVSDMEGLQSKKDNLLPEFQLLSVDKNVSQLHVVQHEQVLSVVAETVQPGKEDIQTDKDQEEGVNALRQALWAERAMLTTLETELENERNAAAVATNEAMAMISRLQEEKSAMQLEVAQLQRMAEEKAEYDEQAMALLKEILFKREAEKYALEKEVELYRRKLLSEKKISQKKGLSKWPSSSLLLPGRGEEEQGLSSSDESSGGLKTLPSLYEFYKSESMCLPFPSKGQNTILEENTQQNGQKFVETQEPKSLQGSFMSDQVDSGVVKDREGSESLFIKSSWPSLPIIFANDKETHIKPEHLQVLKEELQELQEADGVGGLKQSFEVNSLVGSRMSGEKLVTLTTCPGRDVGEHSDESRNRDCLPVHDVHEVHSTPSQLDHYNDGVLMEELEDAGDLKEMAATKCGHRLQVIAHPGGPLPSNESQCNIEIVAGQIRTCRDNKCATLQKSNQEPLVPMDVVEQLLARLQILESDRHVLKEISESVRHRDLELNLLQEIVQHFQQLQQVGFNGLSTNAMHQDPMSPTFVKNCSSAMKRRRYGSDLWQAQVVLLHQKSI